jgi:hypothetical protein
METQALDVVAIRCVLLQVSIRGLFTCFAHENFSILLNVHTSRKSTMILHSHRSYSGIGHLTGLTLPLKTVLSTDRHKSFSLITRTIYSLCPVKDPSIFVILKRSES